MCGLTPSLHGVRFPFVYSGGWYCEGEKPHPYDLVDRVFWQLASPLKGTAYPVPVFAPKVVFQKCDYAEYDSTDVWLRRTTNTSIWWMRYMVASTYEHSDLWLLRIMITSKMPLSSFGNAA